jgi:hypothetical protein
MMTDNSQVVSSLTGLLITSNKEDMELFIGYKIPTVSLFFEQCHHKGLTIINKETGPIYKFELSYIDSDVLTDIQRFTTDFELIIRPEFK